jgi:GTP-binding protein HflX
VDYVDKSASSSNWSTEDSLSELARLVNTIGIRVTGHLIQKLSSPKRQTYVGQGKLDELIGTQETQPIDQLIFDDELTPLQYKTLVAMFPKIEILDRVSVILEIFSRHARTKEGRLQIELARAQYLLPRLTGQWKHLERLGGGIGTRGPGESQLETDRRLIQKRITTIKKDLEKVSKHRALYRKKRQMSYIPIVALVGYTNSGKSSLLKTLTKSDVLVQNQLFATLDPTTRRLCLPNLTKILVTDTVGFIHKLPPTIIEAFKSTLEELQDASILLHVVDISSLHATEQSITVENILAELGIADKPVITVYNKIDLIDYNQFLSSVDRPGTQDFLKSCPENTVMVSAEKRLGLDRLLHNIESLLLK